MLMAWRNLWRNRRGTLVNLGGVAFGILMAATLNGLAANKFSYIVSQCARLGAGNVTIEPKGYLEAPGVALKLDALTPLRKRILAEPGVAAAYPRIQGAALFESSARSQGGYFVAVDSSLENGKDNLLLADTLGGSLGGPDRNSALLGAVLAAKLKLKVGQTVVITVNDVRGSSASVALKVAGVFRTGVDEIDSAAAVLPLDRARSLLGYSADQGTLLALMLDDGVSADAWAERERSRLNLPKAEVLPWNETQPQVDGFLRLDRVIRGLVLAVLSLLIALGIFHTALISVSDRRREFGVMLAIGLSPWALVRLVLTEALLLGLLGAAIGAAISVPWGCYLHTYGIDLSRYFPVDAFEINGIVYRPVLYAQFSALQSISLAAAAVGLVLSASALPAWLAGRVSPVSAMKEAGDR